jgi:hypothetical protein
VQLPGLIESSKKSRIERQEYLVYLTPQGKKESTIIQCKVNGKAYIKKMYFDYCDISDVEIDFIRSICSFESNSKLEDDQIPAFLKNILCGFLIQYHAECYAFFTYGRTSK